LDAGSYFGEQMKSRRRIDSPKAWDCADFDGAFQQGFAAGEMGFGNQVAQQQLRAAHVRFGSLTDITQPN
jgi:hypothetical protein